MQGVIVRREAQVVPHGQGVPLASDHHAHFLVRVLGVGFIGIICNLLDYNRSRCRDQNLDLAFGFKPSEDFPLCSAAELPHARGVAHKPGFPACASLDAHSKNMYPHGGVRPFHQKCCIHAIDVRALGSANLDS